MPKHSENHFGKICATFLTQFLDNHPSLEENIFQGSITCPPFGLLKFIVFVAVFFWSIVEVKEGMFIGTIFKTKNENHHE